MKISLYHRTVLSHKIKQIEVPGQFDDYYIEEDNINESLLIDTLPIGFLPTTPSKILISVFDDETEQSSTGQRGLRLFKNWSKYFSCYMLILHRN